MTSKVGDMARSALITCVVAGVAALTGCGLPPVHTWEPGPTGPSEATTGPDLRPAIPAPTASDAVDGQLEEISVEEFARFWFLAANLGIANNDPEYLKMTSSPDCRLCREAVEAADDRARERSRIEGNLLEVISVRAGPTHCDGVLCRTEVLVLVSQQDGETVLRDGTREPITGSVPVPVRLDILGVAGGWQVLDVEVLPPSEDNV